MHAAIVAGGLGTRAAAMTADRFPKALLPIGGVPIIFRQMRVLRREGVTRLSVLAGHLGDQLQAALAPEAASLGLSLRIVIEPVALGTGGCLAAVESGIEETLVVYGDMLFDIALERLRDFHRRQLAVVTIVAHPNDHPRTSDLIVENEGLVQAILPRGQSRNEDHRNLVPAGLYLVSPSFFSQLENGVRADMIHDVLPEIITRGGRVAAYNTVEYLRDVGSPARHQLAERDLAAGLVERLNGGHPRPAIFFDCDGVLNEEPGLHGALVPDDIKIIPGAGIAVRRAREAGRLAVAVTNRPQVAKGMVTVDGLTRILGRLEVLLADEGGVLDRIYFCPHHPQRGFPGEVAELKVQCECRKPGTLLLRHAVSELPIDQKRSVLIGDSLRDIGAARRLGIWAYGVRTGHGCRDAERYRCEFGIPPVPDLMFESVAEAVDFNISYAELSAPIITKIRAMIEAAKRPLVIAVCGRSRAGKSVIAHALQRALTEQAIACLLVRLDDWIVPAEMRSPGSAAEARNRVDAMPEIVQALRSGVAIHAPGYEAATRGFGDSRLYDPAGRSVIVLDGSFAGHRGIRQMLDMTIFVEVPAALQRARFAKFYGWKGLERPAIDQLWEERTRDEWPVVDTQRCGADVIIGPQVSMS